MTTQQKVDALLRQAIELPEADQAELVQSLIDIRAQHFGIYQLDDDEREALAQSAEDVRLGRLSSADEVEKVFDRYDG